MIRTLLAAGLWIGLAIPASAALSFTIDSPAFMYPGGLFDSRCQSVSQFCLIMTGIIGSNAGDDIFINDYQATLSSPFLTDDVFHGFFFTYGPPGEFIDGDSYTGGIFEIDLSPITPLGLYTGTITLQGGSDPGAFDLIASQGFQVQVIPEPAAYILTLAGLATLAVSRRRRSPPEC